MKLRKILCFALMLVMLVGVVPMTAFASEYTAPSADEVTENFTADDDTFIYDAKDFNEVVTEDYKNLGYILTTTVVGETRNTDHVNHLRIVDDSYATAPNIFVENGSLIWRSPKEDATAENSNKNYFQLALKNQLTGKGFVISFNITKRTEESLTKNLPIKLNGSDELLVLKTVDNWISGRRASGGDFAITKLVPGVSTNITVHMKNVGEQMLYDVYVNGVCAGSNLVWKTSGASSYKLNNIQFFSAPATELKDTSGAAGVDLVSLESFRFYHADDCFDTACGTNPHDYSVYTKIDGDVHSVACSVCGKTKEEEHSYNDYGGCYDCEGAFTNISVSVKDDFTIKYYTDVNKNLAEGSKVEMKFTMDEKTFTIDKYTEENGKYVFAFDGIGPHQLGSLVNAELMIDGVTVDEKTDYSIENYCIDVLDYSPYDAKLVALVKDILIYGNAAGSFKGIDTPVDITDIQGSGLTATEADKNMSVANKSDTTYAYSAGVHFNVVNKIYFKIKSDTADFTVQINGTDATATSLGDGTYIVYTDNIAPTAYDEVQTLTITVREEVVSTVTYTVNTYCFNMKDNSEMSALANALYNFGKSCVAYAQ